MYQKRTFAVVICMFILSTAVTLGWIFGAIDASQWKEALVAIAAFGTPLALVFMKAAQNRMENRMDNSDEGGQ